MHNLFPIEIIMLMTLGCLCAIVSVTDCKTGLIHNRALVVFFLIAVVLDCIYYGFFVRDVLGDFAINCLVVIAASLLLFFTYSFAGGDCKFVVVAAFLYPARCYFVYEDSIVTLVFAVGFAIVLGYLFLLSMSLYDLLAKKKSVGKGYLKTSLIRFIKSFLIASIYIAAIVLLANGAERIFSISINRWILRALCLCMALLVGRFAWFKKLYPVLTVAALVCALSVALRCIPFSTHIESYCLSFVLLFFQLVIRTDLYYETPISQLNPGMILSMMSSMMMQGSRVVGLPGISREDLRDRLTQDQVDSIGRWAKARNIESLVVVRKIPFGVFLAMGFVCYFVLWSVSL